MKSSFNALEELKVEEANKPDGRIDIVCTAADTKKDKRESTPWMVLEFGLKGIDWWKKLDQGIKYVERMRIQAQPTKCVRCEEPLLLAIITVDEDRREESGDFVVKLGVFLCSRKNVHDETYEFRMSLLWHSKMTTLQDGSAMLGRLLRVTSDFRRWRNDPRERPARYEYFSSNCCKVDEVVSGDWISCSTLVCNVLGNQLAFSTRQVLRCYDSRFRQTNRSPDVYLSKECQDIVGGKVRTVLELPKEEGNADADDNLDYSSDEMYWKFSHKPRGYREPAREEALSF